MNDQIRIDIDLLERATAVLIQHLRERQGAEVLIDHDYFWSVPRDEVHDFEQTPANLTIGQVTECLEWLGGVVREPEEAIGYHLVWLGDVFRAIGQEVLE